MDVVVDEGDSMWFDLGEAFGVCGLEGFRGTGFEVERFVIGVMGVVGGADGAGGVKGAGDAGDADGADGADILKLLESGAFRNGERDILSLLKGREIVLFDIRLFNFGVEVFLRRVVGAFNSAAEGFLDIGKGADDS